MINIKEIADRIYRVHTKLPNVFQAFTTYFINESMGVLIDPGPAGIVPEIQSAIKELAMKNLAFIIPTHIHVDHCGGTGNLVRIYSDARVIAHKSAKVHLINPSKLIESTRKAYGDNFESTLGAILETEESRIDILDDYAQLKINGRELIIVHTPGHAASHIAVFDCKTRGLFCGEALGARTKSAPLSPLPNAAPPSFDMELYLRSIEKCVSLKPNLLFYAHDGVSREPEILMTRVADNTKRFGEIILEALRRGDSLEAITQRIRNYTLNELSVNANEVGIGVIIDAFIHYFKSKGLVK